MTNVPLGQSAFQRVFGEGYAIELLNRFLEEDPTNRVEGIALLARPGTAHFLSVGNGQMRRMAHQPGVFGDDLFIVMGNELFRFDGTTVTAISGAILSDATPSITFVAGAGFEHLFISDGLTLQFYDGISASTGTLTVSTPIIALDVVEMGGIFYQWVATSVDAGTPLGTMADPFLVDLGISDTVALANIVKALNNSGLAGTEYSTAITIPHATVEGISSTATLLSVKARTRGVAGDAITTTETGAGIAWGNPTLTGGGVHALNGVVTPDDKAVVSLTNIVSHVILVLANDQRFYWITPGELTIDPLNFAEAENEPDEVIEAIRVGDNFYLVGQTSTEIWFPTGTLDPNESPFAPLRGLSFSQGVLEGTAVALGNQNNQIVLVGEDGIVYQIAGGPRRISNNGIEERIRLSRAALGV